MLYATYPVRRGIDHKPPSLPTLDEHLLEGITEEHSPEETTQPPSLSTEKRRCARCSRRPVFERGRRIACLIIVFTVVGAAGGLLYLQHPGWAGSEQLEEVVSPVIGRASGTLSNRTAEAGASTGEASSKEDVGGSEEEGQATPDDPTLYLTVPKLGIYDHTVRNDNSEEALDLGAIKLPYTGFPWQRGDTNTYMACHRLGWPDTESYNQCLDLPSMQEGDQIILKDANGTVYEYRVVETLTVGPDDTWVTDPVAGKNMVSLQTCIEAPGDLLSLGPSWSARFVVRAERIEEGQGGDLRRDVEGSITHYVGLLYTPAFSYYYDRVTQVAKRTIGILERRGVQALTTEPLSSLGREDPLILPGRM